MPSLISEKQLPKVCIQNDDALTCSGIGFG